jgi:hypothetical protein
MTAKEFNEQGFKFGDKIKFEGSTYQIVSINFKSGEFGYYPYDDENNLKEIGYIHVEFIAK